MSVFKFIGDLRGDGVIYCAGIRKARGRERHTSVKWQTKTQVLLSSAVAPGLLGQQFKTKVAPAFHLKPTRVEHKTGYSKMDLALLQS